MRLRIGAMALGAATAPGTWPAFGADSRMTFPENFAKGVLYDKVDRGSIHEDTYTDQAAIDAVRSGKSVLYGTAITLVDARGGKLFRYVVMQKGQGWSAEIPADRRTGDWQFQWFSPDHTVKHDEDIGRCVPCHQSQAACDFVWTRDALKTAP